MGSIAIAVLGAPGSGLALVDFRVLGVVELLVVSDFGGPGPLGLDSLALVGLPVEGLLAFWLLLELVVLGLLGALLAELRLYCLVLLSNESLPPTPDFLSSLVS